jgi:hypothetical protein
LHEAFAAFLGRAAFMVPLGFAFAGVLVLVRTLRPAARIPLRRLAGVGALLLAVLTSEDLLTDGRDGSGIVGQWLGALFLDLLGPAVTVLLLVTALIVGTLLAFDLKVKLPQEPAPAPGPFEATTSAPPDAAS